MINKFLNIILPWRNEIAILKEQIVQQEQEIEKVKRDNGLKLDKMNIYVQQMFSEKHEMIMEDRNKLDELELYAQRLFTEKHEMIMEDRNKLDELELFVQRLFTEKHEMIMEDRDKLVRLELNVQKLFTEKHEMILEDRNRLDELDLYVQKLFHEKHEMILGNRKEILELVRGNLLKYYENKQNNGKEKELEFLKKNPIQMYPYDWTKEYDDMPIECLQDEQGYLYVVHKNKNLYFPITYSRGQAVAYYRFLLLEQDERSPHCYDLDQKWDSDSVFIDVGAAEGMISLDMIDKVDKIYVFECSEEWNEALKRTFQPYGDKVVIVNKFVGNVASKGVVKLNDIFDEEKKYIIKIDVEGNESKVLEGMQGMHLKQGSCILICCYHHQEDKDTIVDYFESQLMKYEIQKGYMLSNWGGYQEPYFRRGICKACCISKNVTLC